MLEHLINTLDMFFLSSASLIGAVLGVRILLDKYVRYNLLAVLLFICSIFNALKVYDRYQGDYPQLTDLFQDGIYFGLFITGIIYYRAIR